MQNYIIPKRQTHIVDYLKKSIYFTATTLIFLLIETNFVSGHEMKGENQLKTLVNEEPTKITAIAMHVDPEHPEPGDEFTLGFRIKNNSTVTAENLNVTINLPALLELVSGGKKVHLGSLGSFQERFVSWKMRANASGDFIIDLDFETSNLGMSQSKWLLEIFPRFTGIFLSPLGQFLVTIVLVALVALMVSLIRKRSRRSRNTLKTTLL